MINNNKHNPTNFDKISLLVLSILRAELADTGSELLQSNGIEIKNKKNNNRQIKASYMMAATAIEIGEFSQEQIEKLGKEILEKVMLKINKKLLDSLRVFDGN